MKRKRSRAGLKKAEAGVSTSSNDQQKNFDDRFDRIEAKIMENHLNVGELVQRIETLLAEKKDPIGIKKYLKQGTLQATFNIDDISNAGSGKLYSETTYCAGAKWWLDLCKEEEEDEIGLGLYLHCKAESVNISYDVYSITRLLGSLGNVIRKSVDCFTSEDRDWGWSSFILWSKLVNFTNGYVDEKGNFKIEVVFSVTGKKTVCALLDTQFLTCGFVESNCTLLVEGRRFPVNKGLLAAYSNYFKNLFFGEFLEKQQDEIELKELRAEEFLYLLKVIYPPFRGVDVNKNNVESLLRLADCYQVKAVTDRCLYYLKKCAISEVPLPDKFLYAQNYGLPELLEHCIEKLKTFDDVKKLRETGQYSLLDNDIKLRIYESTN